MDFLDDVGFEQQWRYLYEQRYRFDGTATIYGGISISNGIDDDGMATMEGDKGLQGHVIKWHP